MRASAHDHLFPRLLVLAALLASALGWGGSAAAQATVAGGRCRPWKVVPAPGLQSGQLKEISGTSSSDLWAVGQVNVDPTTPLIGHWDGAAWTDYRQDELIYSSLYGVVAIAPNDAWAVGNHDTLDEVITVPLVEHWDGTAWSVEQVPIPGVGNRLYAVDASSASDVWAVGNWTGSRGTHGLVLRWDGTAWTMIPVDETFYGEIFFAVAAISPDDVWAVGYRGLPFSELVPITEHWDGISWTVVHPAPSDPGYFYAVSAVSADDVWAVGAIGLAKVPMSQHWDGVQWTNVELYDPQDRQFVMYDVEAIASNDVWAVGGKSDEMTVAQHWDGARWTWTAPWSGPASQFSGVTATSATDIWAVGWYVEDDVHPLIEHARRPCPTMDG